MMQEGREFRFGNSVWETRFFVSCFLFKKCMGLQTEATGIPF